MWLEEEVFTQMIGDGNVALMEDVNLDEGKKSASEVEYPLRSGLESTVKPTIAPIIHLSYSVTWFTLALAGAIMTYSKFRRRPIPSAVISKKSV